MTTTSEAYRTTPLGENQNYGVVEAKFNAEGDVTSWYPMNGPIQYGFAGPADAATVALQFCPVDPRGALAPLPVEVDDQTGDPYEGGYSVEIARTGFGYYRLINQATFGPAANVANRTLDALVAAINGWQLPQNFVAPLTAPQPLVAAVRTADNVVVLTAATAGVAGNAIATTETLANGSFGAATLTGGVALAAALGTLTFATAAAANNDTVTINGRVYTFKTALTTTAAANEVLRGTTLTNSRDNLLLAINRTGVGATQTGTFASNVVAGDTIRIDDKIYTFVAALTSTPYQVFIGVDLTASRNNLVAAIMGTAGGTAQYSQTTPPHPTVTAVASSTDALIVQAKTPGVQDYDIVTLDTGSHFSWAGAVLAGGTGPGITYGTGTVINADVTAAAVSTNQLTATAKTSGSAGNAITTTESGANTSWGAATLASGADAVKATGTLTMAGAFVDTNTVTIGSVVYTFNTALNATAGHIKIAGIQIDVTMSGNASPNFAQN